MKKIVILPVLFFSIFLFYQITFCQDRQSVTILGTLKVDSNGHTTFTQIDDTTMGYETMISRSHYSSSIKSNNNIFTGNSIHSKVEYSHKQNIRLSDKISSGTSFSSANRSESIKDQISIFRSYESSPLTTNEEEVLLFEGQIWQRKFSEKEFFLAPCVEDVGAYLKRIKDSSHKYKFSQKTKFSFLKVIINPLSINLLNKIGIVVPNYIKDSVLVMLPQCDIEFLKQNQIPYTLLLNYGKNQFSPDLIIETKSVIWSEDWEGSLALYTMSGGCAYWGDVDCENHTSGGSWSLWCADDGSCAPSTNCSNYVDNMLAHVYKTSGIDVGGYSNVQFKFYKKYSTESSYDYLYRYYSSN